MKIFCFTDLHSNSKILVKVIKKIKASKPEIIIFSGDLTSFGVGLEKIIVKLKETKILTLIIPGNHDPEKLKEKCSENLIFMHKKIYSIGNYTFFGYGEEGFAKISEDMEKLIPKIKKIMKEKFIFITHMQPYNTKLDYLPHLKQHVGNKSARKLIKELKPVLTVAGHFHETFNKKDCIKNSLIINPGPEGKLMNV